MLRLSQTLRLCLLALSICSASALAIPALEISTEVLLYQLPDLKKSLKLNPNQLVLWQQSEATTRTLLRAQTTRRKQVSERVRQMLDLQGVDLRDIDKNIAAETALSQQENGQLREIWLTVNDALDDSQRAVVVHFLKEQLARSIDSGEHNDQGDRGGKGKQPGGEHGGPGGKPPGGMGVGMSGGSGNASGSISGNSSF
jgi:hypothetical protein